MRILFLGDMVGKTGREAVYNRLPKIRDRLSVDLAIVNGENAASGFGITRKIYQATLDAGADVVTTGNHVFDQKEVLNWASEEDRFLRPANWPGGVPGRGSTMVETNDGRRVLVANIMGRVFMHPELDDPFKAAEDILAAAPMGDVVDAIVIDFHAEATSEKQCFGHFVDGRASLVVGTHTHIPTADHQVLVGGTGYLSDAGMCGDYDSSLGMDKEEPLNRFLTKVPKGRMEPASGEATVCGVLVVTDDSTGLATGVEPLRVGGRLAEVWPTI
ncbi:TIGR00282 family metallophosphoesterase [Ahrensia sp. R2A130]|uniref:TIGR00282 family metallophosphoesterase n=1 Tax=Ahrensia sp. R2A130 TaxID=744979 RepID=UPI0001E0B52F|nr:TIGR00282 family metallophosphoesterase [Ahrensia sp. R2A130]EFL87795.1 metallophosphoesterase [Ahrensia sp. R2A130]